MRCWSPLRQISRPRGMGLALTLALVACAPAAPAASRPAPPPAAAAPTAGAAAPTAAAAPATGPLSPPGVVRAATTPSISNGGRYIALERGYFREEGLEIEDVPSDTSAQLLPSLAAGQVDLLSGGTASGLFNAIAQGIPLRIVLDQWTGFPGNDAGGVIVRKELIDSGRLRDPADLRGMRVAMTSKGHNTQMVLSRLLASVGLTFADVESFEMPYPEMNTALGNNNIDAAVMIEPMASQAINGGYAARYRSWADVIPYDAIALVMYSQAFAEGKNDAAKRYARAYVRGLRAYQDALTKGTNREEVISYFIKHTALKDRSVYDWLPWPSSNPDGRVPAETIAAAQDWFAENGYVQTKVDLSKVIDNQFADFAVAQLGPYQP
jgi:NitT/TauT family transport system substrate-binding protein